MGIWIDENLEQVTAQVDPHVRRILRIYREMCPTNDDLGVVFVKADGATPFWQVNTELGFVRVSFAFSDKLKLHLKVHHERGALYFHNDFADMLRYSCQRPVIVV